MNAKRKIEIFSAGCELCEDVVKKVQDNSCSSCDVEVLDMMKPAVVNRAKKLGVKTVPAVAIDDKLAECCTSSGPNISILKKAGLGNF